MADDATRQGVSEEVEKTELQDSTPPEVQISPRLEALKAIGASRKAQLEAEVIEGGGTVEEPPKEEPAPEPVAEEPPPPQLVKLKVDGEEREVPAEEVMAMGVKAYQKELAADKRLEEAARQKRANDEEAARIKQAAEKYAQEYLQQKFQQQPQEPPKTDAPVDDLVKQAVAKIQYGGEAEAVEAFNKSVEQAAERAIQRGLTGDGLMNAVTQRINDIIEFRESSKWLADEFRDVVADPYLFNLMRLQEASLRSAGDVRPYREIWSEIGSKLREYKKPPEAPQTRAERKATVVTIPQASARPAAPTQPKELSPSEIVERMRKARHQSN